MYIVLPSRLYNKCLLILTYISVHPVKLKSRGRYHILLGILEIDLAQLRSSLTVSTLVDP